ncbi:MAG: 4-hydroxy-tetrahydrodipicolinate reductase [Bacteroidota bacterium]
MKIALLGYGKMGREIERLALGDGDEVVLRVDRNNRASFSVEQLQMADVAIEFSRPEAALANIRWALEAQVPVVCGTTGWLQDTEGGLPQVQSWVATHSGAFFYASNFSIGVNMFFLLNRYLAGMMAKVDGYRASLQETHHTQKLDAPSGTAITLAEGLINQHPTYKEWKLMEEVWPENMAEKNTAGEGAPAVNSTATLKSSILPITSCRLPDVPGTHQITYQSTQDSLSIEHKAHSREGFARGALAAARWVIGKKGIFGMEDLLDLSE